MGFPDNRRTHPTSRSAFTRPGGYRRLLLLFPLLFPPLLLLFPLFPVSPRLPLLFPPFAGLLAGADGAAGAADAEAPLVGAAVGCWFWLPPVPVPAFAPPPDVFPPVPVPLLAPPPDVLPLPDVPERADAEGTGAAVAVCAGAFATRIVMVLFCSTKVPAAAL